MENRAAILLAALALACSPGATPDFARAESALITVGPGNGPHLMVVCANANAGTFPTNPNCGAATINSAADLSTALAVPALDPAQTFPVAHSFVLPHEVNFWSYTVANPNQGAFFATASGGNMDVDDRSLFPGASPTSAAPTNYARAFTGYLAVPQPAGTTGDFVKTLAVGVNDGAFFAIRTCTQKNATSCGSGTQLVTISRLPGGSFGYVGSAIVFPAGGGFFPFMLAASQNGGNSGLELAWADGNQTGALPSFGNARSFTLVSMTSMYSPDVRAPLAASGALAAGGQVTFSSTVSNEGTSPAFPGKPVDGGLLFTLALPRAAFLTDASQYAAQVNGLPANVSVTTNAAEVFVTVPVKSPGDPDGALQPGLPGTVVITATLTPASAGTWRVQGRITGHGTDPGVFPAALSPGFSLAVLTDDPTTSDGIDTGNAPAGLLGYAVESPTVDFTHPVVLIQAVVGNADDDPLTLLVVPDTTPPLPPAVTLSSAGSPLPSGGFTRNRSVIVQVATQEADGTATVSVNGTAVCSNVPVPSNKSVSCQLSALADGDYAVSAVHSDAAGNASAPGTASFHIDGTTSPTPVFTPPATPTSNPQPALSGTGYPGSSVTVQDAGGSPICATTVTAAKAWSCTPSAPLPDLDYVLTAAGGPPNGSGTSNAVPLSVRHLPAPTLSGPASTDQTQPALTIGASAQGQVATVFEGTNPLCSATVGASLTAVCDASAYLPGAALSVGDHVLVAVVSQGTARSQPSAPLAVEVVPTAPHLTSPATVGTTQPLLTGSGATPLSTVTVADGATGGTACAAPAGVDGSFTCQVGTSPAGFALGSGSHALTLIAQLAGKTSAPRTEIVGVDATPQLAPLASPTRNPQPLLCAALRPGVPGGTALLVSDGIDGAAPLACSTPLDGGVRSACCTPAAALAEGAHALVARLRFPPGGTSDPSDQLPLVVKTHTATPVVSSPAEGTSHPGLVSASGTAEAGVTVEVSVDGRAQPKAAADASGAWSVEVGPLATGTHSLFATATDAAGNQAKSAERRFEVSLGGHVEGSSFGCSSAGGSGSFAALLVLAVVPLLRRRRAAAAAAGAALLCAASARAQTQDVALDHFRPASGGDGTIGVEGARPPEDGDPRFEARLWGQGQSRPLVYVPDSGSSTALIRNRIGGWLAAQAHVWGPFSAAVQLPFLLGQHGDLSGLPSDLGGGSLAGGVGDLRATLRAGLLRQERAPLDVAVQASLELPTAQGQTYLGGQVQGEALAAAGRRLAFAGGSALDLLGNLFVRLRPARDVLEVKTGSELGLRAAAAWLPQASSAAVPRRVLIELEGASFLRAGFASGSVPAEWRAGISYCLGRLISLDLGAGGGLVRGIGTPGLRLVGGVGLSPSECGAAAALVRPAAPSRIAGPIATAVSTSTSTSNPTASSTSTPSTTTPTSTPTSTPISKPTSTTTPAATPASTASQLAPPPPELPALPLQQPPAPEKPKQKRRTVAAVPALPLPSLPSAAATAAPLPALVPLAPLDADVVPLAGEVLFDGLRLLPSSQSVLDGAAMFLSGHPEIRLVGISASRPQQARAVVAYLRRRGISLDRLRAEGTSAAVELRILRRR